MSRKSAVGVACSGVMRLHSHGSGGTGSGSSGNSGNSSGSSSGCRTGSCHLMLVRCEGVSTAAAIMAMVAPCSCTDLATAAAMAAVVVAVATPADAFSPVLE